MSSMISIVTQTDENVLHTFRRRLRTLRFGHAAISSRLWTATLINFITFRSVRKLSRSERAFSLETSYPKNEFGP
jgi:UV DNA damage repair endonuclease